MNSLLKYVHDPVDLLIIGGGINGAGIARDAAGRGLSVVLCEQTDFGAATSSASSKLIHGGLRYLEYYDFGLVGEALSEREILLRNAPHIISPLSFVLPHHKAMRPAWLLRLGLFLYDRLGKQSLLERSRGVNLKRTEYGAALKPEFKKGFIYSDCVVDDARLVILNIVDAVNHGADVFPHTECVDAQRQEKFWLAKLKHKEKIYQLKARAIVNAAGPWAQQVLQQNLHQDVSNAIRLVKGSHIVVPKLYSGDFAYLLQNDDRRIVFLIPFQQHFTLIGTTDVKYTGDPRTPEIDASEIDYLCQLANRYLKKSISAGDVVWTYSGVRPLYDDGKQNPSAVTRDYKLRLDESGDGPLLLSVFGGKVTTYRQLAEQALIKLAPWFPLMKKHTWTAQRPLPGGNLPERDFTQLLTALTARYPKLPITLLHALAKRHGTLTYNVLENTQSEQDLGPYFGADLYGIEVDHFIRREWATSAEDILWRRTKAGLFLSEAQQQALARYVDEYQNAGAKVAASASS